MTPKPENRVYAGLGSQHVADAAGAAGLSRGAGGDRETSAGAGNALESISAQYARGGGGYSGPWQTLLRHSRSGRTILTLGSGLALASPRSRRHTPRWPNSRWPSSGPWK